MPIDGRALRLGVIHYRVPDVLRTCLEHLHRHAAEVHVTVVDTSGDDSLARALDGLASAARPDAVLTCANVGLAHAVDRFLAHALRSAPDARVLGHMNADVYVGPTTVADLLAEFDDDDVGLVGPTARTPDGSLQPMGPSYRLQHVRRALTRRRAIDVPWVSGCLQLVRRDALVGPRGVGGMDASFRFYNEDLEWCLRLRRAGWRVRLVGSDVEHLGGASTPSAAVFRIEGYRGGMALRRRLHGPWMQALHRAAVRAEAAVRQRAPDPEVRHAYRVIARMFARDAYDVSPFGATLADVAPAFEAHAGLAPRATSNRVASDRVASDRG